jgi:endo-alpha-1,4-polygalactosaminidase (GH114 family)
LFACLIVVLAVAVPANAAPRDPRLARVSSWALAIGSGDLDGDYAARYAPFDLVVVDGEGVTARQVGALHARGKIVLGYLSVGTIEKGRFWFARAKRYRLELWDDWGEWYADVSKRGYRKLIARTVAPRLRAKRLDGLFLDNVDMVDTHPRQRAGMVALVKTLARDNGLLFAQNGDDFMPHVARWLDGWNREGVTSTYDFDSRNYVRVPAAERRDAQATLRAMAKRGLLVTATDNVAAGGDPQPAIDNACAAGALPYVADIELQRVPAEPLRCTVSAP